MNMNVRDQIVWTDLQDISIKPLSASASPLNANDGAAAATATKESSIGNGSGLLESSNRFELIAARHREYRKTSEEAEILALQSEDSPSASASPRRERSSTPLRTRATGSKDIASPSTTPISSSPLRHMQGLRLESSSPRPPGSSGFPVDQKSEQLTVRNAVLKFCQLDHSMTLLKQQLKELESKKSIAQKELTAACKQVNVLELDLSLLPHDILQSIGGPGTLKLKVRKRLGNAPESKSRSGGSATTAAATAAAAKDWYKEVCVYALKKQNHPNPESTWNEWVQAYETDQNYEPVDISIQRERKRLKVLQPSAAILTFSKPNDN